MTEILVTALTVELEDRADAAWGAWLVSRAALGDEVLTLARDGVPLGCRSVSWRSRGGKGGLLTAVV